MDYDDDDPPPQVPTFSGTSHGSRGAGSKANASRASASKSAVSAASRASAIMTASIQQISKKSIITSNGIRSTQQGPVVNKAAIDAVQKRMETMMKTLNPPKLPEIPAVYESNPLPRILQPPNTPVVNQVLPNNPSTHVQQEIKHIEEPAKPIISTVSEPHKIIVQDTLKKKEEMLKEFIPRQYIVSKKYGPIKYITIESMSTDLPIIGERLNQLCNTLATIIHSSSDNKLILDAYKKYNCDVRLITETSHHKDAINNAITNKKAYFTSDA